MLPNNRWVGYTELPKDLIGNQERAPKLMNHMRDPANSEIKAESNSKLSRRLGIIVHALAVLRRIKEKDLYRSKKSKILK